MKVRENLTSYEDPGWYENPPGTLASLASNDELQRDLGKIPEAEPMDKIEDGPHKHGSYGHEARRLNPPLPV